MVIFDSVSWRPIEIYKMRERDEQRRASCPSLGYEDVRIFRTDKGGLQGIGASLHLRRDKHPRNQLAEQVLLSFDAKYNVIAARPIRGDWGTRPQKNWVPFDNCAEPRFLYSISEGALFSERGPLASERAHVQPATRGSSRALERGKRSQRRAEELAVSSLNAHDQGGREHAAFDRWRGPADLFSGRSVLTDLRGGTQLVSIGDDRWLGIGHAMRLVEGLKYYWHVWYVVDSRGKVKSASSPMKLAPHGIEFAAGMTLDGDRVVVSFGVDDMECKIGETRLSAVLEMLERSAIVK